VNADVSDPGTRGVGFTLGAIFQRIPCQRAARGFGKGFAWRRRHLNVDRRTLYTASPLRFTGRSREKVL
jgi:hypothetical protein